MEEDKTATVPQRAVDASYNFVTEQLQNLADQFGIPIEAL